MLKLKAALVSLAVLIGPSLSRAACKLDVVYIDFPPFYSTNSEGKPDGLLIKRVQSILKGAGCKGDFHYLPANRMRQSIVDGRFDSWMGVSAFPEFKDNTLISKELFVKMVLKMWSTNARPLNQKTFSERKSDLRLALMLGHSYGGLAESLSHSLSSEQIVFVKDRRQAFDLLNHGRVSGFLDYDVPFSNWMKENKIKNISSFTISEVPGHIVVSKKTQGASAIMKRLEASLKKINQADPNSIERP